MNIRKHFPPLWRLARMAETRDELLDVGRLRRLAYSSAGKVPPTDEPLLDEFDEMPYVRSLYIPDPRSGTPLATIRLECPRSLTDPVSHDGYFPWPRTLPARTSVAEVNRLAVRPMPGRRAVMVDMMRALLVHLARERRLFVAASAYGRLLHYYYQIGFKDIGIRYRNPIFHDIEHVVIAADLEACVLRRHHSNWLYWWLGVGPIFGEVARHLPLTKAESLLLGAPMRASALLDGVYHDHALHL